MVTKTNTEIDQTKIQTKFVNMAFAVLMDWIVNLNTQIKSWLISWLKNASKLALAKVKKLLLWEPIKMNKQPISTKKLQMIVLLRSKILWPRKS